jgi:diguanylate cyclase (GGDEF)-like protein
VSVESTESSRLLLEERTARRSRLANVAIVVLLIGVSIFALYSSRVTSAAAQRAAAASHLSDDYAAASMAVATEESLERKYHLEPGPLVRANFDAAARELADAMLRVRQDGDDADRSRADRIRADHDLYLAAIARQFRAIDRHETATAQRIDTLETEPSFDRIARSVNTAAIDHHNNSLAELARLQHVDAVTTWLTPSVFVVGLLLAAALASVARGIGRLREIERTQAVHNATHDALTGLPNRKLLADRLSQALLAARRDSTSAGLLLVDLDRFKEINDTFGHHSGDLLLAQIGPRFSSVLGDVGTVARLGGDEFAILLPAVDGVQGAVLVAENLRAALGEPFRVEDVEFDVEASIGIVLSGVHGGDASLLLQRADIAMYVAKNENLGISVYDPAVDGHSPAKLALLGDLRRALERRELFLLYQPKVGIGSGGLVGVEALVRWQHPVHGLVQPDDFVPLAEHTGLVGPLTRYVLDSALQQARMWMDANNPVRVAVNLSARNLLDDTLPDIVAAALEFHGVPAAFLELEVTETALMTEPARARRLLESIAELGVRISIDDFGAGYTSLGQLQDLPISELKIDRSFVTMLTEERGGSLIVQSVIELGHNLGLTIVAEGVESDTTICELAAMGCDVAQGYHVSPPMSVPAFEAWLADRRCLARRSALSGQLSAAAHS